jgi:hypothetical protein
LFEKYLRQQYLRRFALVQKEISEKQIEKSELQELVGSVVILLNHEQKDMTKEQQLMIVQLKDLFDRQLQENASYRKKYEHYVEDCERRFKAVKDENNALREHNHYLKMELENQEVFERCIWAEKVKGIH